MHLLLCMSSLAGRTQTQTVDTQVDAHQQTTNWSHEETEACRATAGPAGRYRTASVGVSKQVVFLFHVFFPYNQKYNRSCCISSIRICSLL